MKRPIISAVAVFLACASAFPQEAPLSPPRVVVSGNLMGAEASSGNVLPEANPFRDFLQRLKAALETRDTVAVQALYQTNGSSAQELKDELGRWQPMLVKDAGHRVSIQERGCVFRDFRKSSKMWKNFAERVTTHKATHLVQLNTTKGYWLLPLVDLEGTLFIVPADKSKDTRLRQEDVQQDGAADGSQLFRSDTNSPSAAAGRQHDPYAHLYNNAAQARPHERLLIEPRVSVGKIKTGMTIEEVLVAVGKPDRRSQFNLEYLRFGFAATANRQGIVRVIQCGDPCDKTSPLIKMFVGRTKEGIGMESTRSEVVAALGDPTKSMPWGAGEERLVYSELGLAFNLADGKVHFIEVSLKPK